MEEIEREVEQRGTYEAYIEALDEADENRNKRGFLNNLFQGVFMRDNTDDLYAEGSEMENDYKDTPSTEGGISVKQAMAMFVITAVLMIVIFVLKVLHILPWWGTLIASVGVIAVILIYGSIKKN